MAALSCNYSANSLASQWLGRGSTTVRGPDTTDFTGHDVLRLIAMEYACWEYLWRARLVEDVIATGAVFCDICSVRA